MLNFDKYREEVEKRSAWAVREGSKKAHASHPERNRFRERPSIYE